MLFSCSQHYYNSSWEFIVISHLLTLFTYLVDDDDDGVKYFSLNHRLEASNTSKIEGKAIHDNWLNKFPLFSPRLWSKTLKPNTNYMWCNFKCSQVFATSRVSRPKYKTVPIKHNTAHRKKKKRFRFIHCKIDEKRGVLETQIHLLPPIHNTTQDLACYSLYHHLISNEENKSHLYTRNIPSKGNYL